MSAPEHATHYQDIMVRVYYTDVRISTPANWIAKAVGKQDDNVQNERRHDRFGVHVLTALEPEKL